MLLVATVLGKYKPKGLTAYGARKDGRAVIANTPRWVRLMLGSVALALLCVAFLIGVEGHGPGDHTSRP